MPFMVTHMNWPNFSAEVGAALPQQIKADPELSKVSATELEAEFKEVQQTHSGLMKELGDVYNRPQADFGHMDLKYRFMQFVRYDGKSKLTDDELFPCLPKKERAVARQFLNMMVNIEAINPFTGVKENFCEMDARLKEFREGKRSVQEGYIILRTMLFSNESVIGITQSGPMGGISPYMDQKGLLIQKRTIKEPELKEFRLENLIKRQIRIGKDIAKLIEKHPEVTSQKSFGLRNLTYLEGQEERSKCLK